MKRSKRRGVGVNGGGTTSGLGGATISGCREEKSGEADKNGGTWPKARISPLIQNGTGTILHPRKTKERLPLSALLNNPTKFEPSAYNYNRISNPISLSNFNPIGVGGLGIGGMSSNNSNRHTVYKAVESPLPHMSKAAQLNSGQKSFVPSAAQFKELIDKRSINDGISSDTSVEFSVIKSSRDHDYLYGKSKRGTPINVSPKYPIHDLGNHNFHPNHHQQQQQHHHNHHQQQHQVLDSMTHNRMHSQFYGSPTRIIGTGNFSIPPYTHSAHQHMQQQQQPSSLNSNLRYPSPPNLPNAQSGESLGLPDGRTFCFEPPYSPQSPGSNFNHLHTPSIDLPHFHKPRAHPTMSSFDVPPYAASTHNNPCFEGGTFPRKKENQRFRIPSNPSVTSKNSIGKLSSGSIEKTSERGSPMPTFHIEILNPGNVSSGNNSGGGGGGVSSKRGSVHDYMSYRPPYGQIRRIHIDKSQEPLGIQIQCMQTGGVFVSQVTDHSLASQIGLQVGDQLLDVCGINMRTCSTYDVAANILRQCGNTFTILVQYSPDSEY